MDAKVELDKKLTLSVEEASELSGIGLNTIRRMMENQDYDMVLWIGKKRRIKREALEKVLPDNLMSVHRRDVGWYNHVSWHQECLRGLEMVERK